MKSPTVYFQRVAADEYRVARDWYAERSAQAAERFRRAVDAAVDRIADDPESHPVVVTSYRQIRVSRFPYVLIYRQVSDERILVVAVAHTSRRPEYWRGR